MSLITHRSDSVSKGKSLISKIKELIPRQLFDVAVQHLLVQILLLEKM